MFAFFYSCPKQYRDIYKTLHELLGYKPKNIQLYITALSHKSIDAGVNNERLEYLGDAILSAIIAEYLFKKYPNKAEGFLTEMRSKIVNRQQLNNIANKVGIAYITQMNPNEVMALKKSQIFGNTLEAIVGALYLDRGYSITKKVVLKKLVVPYVNMSELEIMPINQKNMLISWASRNGKNVDFLLDSELREEGRKKFVMRVVVDDQSIALGYGYTKKQASQMAAIEAIKLLHLPVEE